jgi:hypothetical protein
MYLGKVGKMAGWTLNARLACRVCMWNENIEVCEIAVLYVQMEDAGEQSE